MTELNNRILELLKENRSMKEISTIINISEKQLYIRLKQIINYGYQLRPTYSYNGDIYYNISYGDYKDNSSIRIAMSKKEKSFRCLVISDLHVGNVRSDLNLVNYVYEYAAKEGINYILVCGDNIEGDYSTDQKYIDDFFGQTEELIERYPYDKSINNIMIFGNHDYHALKENGFDILKRIKNSRHDIIPIGYGQGNVNVKGDSLILYHQLAKDFSPRINNNEKIIISGHGHMMKTKIRDELWLCIPTLSYVSTDKTKDVVPGFVELDIDIDKDKFEFVNSKHIIITPKLITVSESRCKIKCLNKTDERN